MYDLNESKWKISEGYELVNRRFGDNTAIYHCGSGDTHLIGDADFSVLEQLNSGARSFEELLKKLTDEYESSDQLNEYLISLLAEFEKLSIIEQLHS
ncbi:MAG: hypothetical protein AMJ53_13320 [Gammaproteobacteria bacterium SG8_11]|nr:MAG: hypothetical protein AMJ53_13320 [Gammaproteobacteria bacterium SG8_11]